MHHSLRDGSDSSSHTDSEQSSASNEDRAAPKDHFYLVYLCMVMGGVGLFTPYCTYVAAIDYFFYYYKEEFPSLSAIFPLTYFLAAFFAATLNIVLVKMVCVYSRITFGYVVFIICLLTVPLLDIGIDNCTIPTTVSFYITLLTVGSVGLGAGVLQSSYYGLSTMLPKKYTQAVMVGESTAEFLAIGFRIISKASLKTSRAGAIVFFSLSLFLIILCVVCGVYIRRSKMVQFYTNKCKSHASCSTASQPLLKMEKISLFKQQPNSNPETNNTTREIELLQELESLRKFWSVLVQIWPLIGAIFCNFYFTVFIYPGLVSEVLDCSLDTWTPIILIAVFGFSDFTTKWLALVPISWSPKQLLVASWCRILLVPLILMCVFPSPLHPLLGVDVVVWASLFTLLLGLSNGYLGSLPLITVSAHVKDERDKELAGTIMTWALISGLVSGAICSYAISTLIGDEQFCTSMNATSTGVFSSCTNMTYNLAF